MIVAADAGVMRAALDTCRRHFLAAAGFSALVNLLYIVPTIYMLQVYDRAVPTHGLLTLLFLTLVLLFALGTLALLDRIRSRLLVRAGVQLDATLAPVLLDATLGHPDAPVARRALRDFDGIRAALTGAGILALFDAPWIPIYVLVCFLVHPWLGAIALVGGLALPALAWGNERATKARAELSQRIANTSYANQEALLGVSEGVRALGMRRALVARQIRQRGAMLQAQTAASFASGNYLTATKFVRLALQSLSLGLGALLAIDNKISGGAIFAASFLVARALAPIEQLIGAWRPLSQARANYFSLSGLLDGSVATVVPTRLPAPEGALALEGIVVTDPSGQRTILDDVSMLVAPGELVVIVGPSGAGKSTLVRVAAGALAPQEGTIRVDGADTRDWDPEELGIHIGYVPQETGLIAGTVAENIARFAGELGGARDTIDEGIVAAAQAVGADPLIRRFPDGYGHRLGLGGGGLSAGQAQRIALARALYGDPRYLILDEPNAHLDVEGDVALHNALLARKQAGATILIVSHKANILPLADKIAFMRNGRIELFGPRDEVLPKITAPRTLRAAPPADAPAAGTAA